MKFISKIALAVLVIASFALGFWTATRWRTAQPAETAAVPQAAEIIWTCSMHPQIRQPKPGKCPICFMDLIPVESSETDSGERQISFSPGAMKLMEVETTPVERKIVETEIRMVGKIAYDETRVKNITAWVPGRIDKLFVDFTGTTLRKGDHIVDIYSPQLLSTQAELIQAAQAVRNIRPETSDLMKRTTEGTLASARKKLRLLGLTDEQIKEIEKTEVPTDHVTLYAPIGGIVIEKNTAEGQYVDTGTRIYTIADLSQVWVLLDAYESDMMWLRYGQEATFDVEAYPGRSFTGTISFIDPRLDTNTRTVKLRVNIPNPDGLLKPGMFVSAVVKSKVAAEGRVMAENLAGQWMCPMHPEIVKDKAGICDTCKMDLVTAESLGYVAMDPAQERPLVIPASAVLFTGKRAVVYVEVPQVEKPTFEGREIVLGPRAGDYYLVREGLAEGEKVVTKGNFKIDSSLQIQAKPSMMNPLAGVAPQAAAGEQTLCPVMDTPINKDIFVEYKGKKVYFCCPGCDIVFLADPEKYLRKLPQFSDVSKPPKDTKTLTPEHVH